MAILLGVILALATSFLVIAGCLIIAAIEDTKEAKHEDTGASRIREMG